MELLLPADLGNKPYRLRCRFRVPAAPPRGHYLRPLWDKEFLKAEYRAKDQFVADMRLRGFEFVAHLGFDVEPRPFVAIDPVTLHRPPRLTARQMLPGVLAGKRFREEENTPVLTVPPLNEAEAWEFELSAVFVHKTIVFEYPYEHEEKEDLRKR